MPLGDAQRPLYEIKANLFKGLAHPYRIRILELLSNAPEVSVQTMLGETALEPSHLSQHLGVLRRYGLVVSERRASIVYYQLAYPEISDLLRVARGLLHELLSSDEARTAAATLPSIARSEEGAA
ncbi:ArsR/SmtB family transcription factor [Leucobacter sp. HY1910]